MKNYASLMRTPFATGFKASAAKGWQSKKGHSVLVSAQLCRPPIGIVNRP